MILTSRAMQPPSQRVAYHQSPVICQYRKSLFPTHNGYCRRDWSSRNKSEIELRTQLFLISVASLSCWVPVAPTSSSLSASSACLGSREGLVQVSKLPSIHDTISRVVRDSFQPSGR